MIKNYVLFSFLFVVQFVQSQIVNIPDINFKAKILASNTNGGAARDLAGNYMVVDTNGNGEIEASEAALVGGLIIVGNPDPVSSLEGIEAFYNMTGFVLVYNLVETLDLSGFQSLKSVICSPGALTTVDISSCPMLEEVDVSLNQVSLLNIADTPSLAKLNLQFAPITTLDLSGREFLYELLAQQTQLTSINLTGCTALEYADVHGSNLTSLDVSGLTALRELQCNENEISDLNLTGCTALQILNCQVNQIASLDLTGLNSLNDVKCGANGMSSLNLDGCTSLKTLWCDTNEFSTLDLSPAINLEYLVAEYNQITSLDINGLHELYSVNLWSNLLTEIELNDVPSLQTITLNANLLTTLDVQNCPALGAATVMQNPNIVSVFAKNGNNANIGFQDCPNLQYMCVDASRVSFIQNNINTYGPPNCHVNSYCSFTPGGNYYTIEGNSRFDFNNDGCDIQDTNFPFMKFAFSEGTNSGSYIADASGSYHYDVQQGTHTISPVMENPTYFNVSPQTAGYTFPADASPSLQDFCITSNGVHPDLEIVMIPIDVARPGFDAVYKIVYRNTGNQMLSGTIAVQFNDALVDVLSALPMYSSMAPDVLNWEFANLNIFESRSITFTVNINSPMETPAVNDGDVLHYVATIAGPTADETPVKNSFSLNQVALNSLDPNDKTCLEGSVVTPESVGDFVHYVIRFENTGTFAAQNIVVQDIINTSQFDINTLIPLQSSHSFETRITEGNKVEFIFENVMLPFDDANNDGYVAFKIKTLPTLVVSNTFSNTASIYFDYNFPIVTNTATTVIQALGTNDFKFSDHFTLYPVPASNVLNVKSFNLEIRTVEIYNVLDQLIYTNPNATGVSSIDTSYLKSGNYFIKIKTDKGSSSAPFIKL